jgi:AcrR family transcriptional regulator
MEKRRRQALLEALIEELLAGGYEGTSPERACAAAGVSTAEFAAEFAGKDAALLAAYEEVTSEILGRAVASCAHLEPWPTRLRVGLATLLEEMAAQARLAQAITCSFAAFRPAAYERYLALRSLFVPFVREGRAYVGPDAALPAEVELLALGSAETIVFAELEAGQAGRLPSMLPEILFSLLVPFLGPERAGEAMRSAAAVS